jgi:hypothetical protein
MVKQGVRLVIAFCLAALIVGVRNAEAGNRLNARAAGMGGAATAIARGLDAIAVNPANLGIPDGAAMTMTVLPLGVNIESDFLTYDMFSKYLNKGPDLSALSDADKITLLDAFENDIGTSSGEAMARLFGITLRASQNVAVAFAVDYNFSGSAMLPREYARMLLYGNVPNSTFEVHDLNIKAYWARTYSLSCGWQMPEVLFFDWLAAGVGVKLIQGYGNYTLDKFEAALRTDQGGELTGHAAIHARWTTTNSIDRPMSSLFEDPSGYGTGFDFGITGGVKDFFRFGASLTDIGAIRWSRDTEELRLDSLTTPVLPQTFQSFRRLSELSGARRQKGDGYTTRLPGVFRVGVAFQLDKISDRSRFPGELLFAADYQSALDGALALSNNSKLSFGIEYKPVSWLPIRTGFSYAGTSKTHLAFGIGISLRYFDLDVATENILFLFDQKSFSKGSLGFGMKVKVSA